MSRLSLKNITSPKAKGFFVVSKHYFLGTSSLVGLMERVYNMYVYVYAYIIHIINVSFQRIKLTLLGTQSTVLLSENPQISHNKMGFGMSKT